MPTVVLKLFTGQGTGRNFGEHNKIMLDDKISDVRIHKLKSSTKLKGFTV